MKLRKFVILFVVILLVAGLAAACGGDETTTAEPAGTTSPEATASPAGEVEADSMWSQIQSSGFLIVGTSSGYPPFEYIDSQTYQLDGFDIALMKEIGIKLGLQIEFRDMAFAGLENALQLKEINAAIAAITVTEDRQAIMDFTDIYYIGTDAVLANQGSQVTISSQEDMVAYRVGVQTGSVYESWLTEDLVDTGKMPAENLLSFETTEEMIQALTSDPPQVDLLWLELKPAQEAIGNYPLQIVAEGLNQLLVAIAVPKEETDLLSALNDALLQLQADGVIAELALKYLGIAETIIPQTPVPVPTAAITPQPPSGCLDSMVYVADLTYPDNIPDEWPVVEPGEAIQKGWQIMNTGTCTWDETYVLVYNGSEPEGVLEGEPTYIELEVAPGAIYDIYVDTVAPTEPGNYVGYYTMQAPSGALFGDRIWVAVEIP